MSMLKNAEIFKSNLGVSNLPSNFAVLLGYDTGSIIEYDKPQTNLHVPQLGLAAIYSFNIEGNGIYVYENVDELINKLIAENKPLYVIVETDEYRAEQADQTIKRILEIYSTDASYALVHAYAQKRGSPFYYF